jgi:hypothetical protein
MLNFTTPVAAWSQGLGLWCRLYQAQIDATLKVWGVWAQALPRPDARAMAAAATRQAQPVKPPRGPRRPATRMLPAPTHAPARQPEAVH